MKFNIQYSAWQWWLKEANMTFWQACNSDRFNTQNKPCLVDCTYFKLSLCLRVWGWSLRSVNPPYLFYIPLTPPCPTLLSPSGLITFPSAQSCCCCITAGMYGPAGAETPCDSRTMSSVCTSLLALITQTVWHHFTEWGCTRAAVFTAHNSVLNFNST